MESAVPNAVWVSVAFGTVLGVIAARIRLASSPLERHRWLMLLGATAGAILAVTVVYALALGAALMDLAAGRTDTWDLLGPTLLVLLLLFVGFVVRRR
jgi:hypothetical protein